MMLLIFIIVICGTVNAVDSEMLNNNHSANNYIENLNSTSTELDYSNTILAMNSISDSSEIGYLGNSKEKSVLLNSSKIGNITRNSKMLKNVNMIVYVSTSRVGTLDNIISQVYKNKLLPEGYDFKMKIYAEDSLSSNPEILKIFSEEIKSTDILLTINLGTTTFNSVKLNAIVQTMPKSSICCRVGGSTGVFKNLNESKFNEYSSAISANLNEENLQRTILHSLKLYKAIDKNTNTTLIKLPTNFVYHPDTNKVFSNREDYIQWYKLSGKYKNGGPWVGIIFHAWYYGANDLKVYNSLIHELENQGANVIVPIFSSFSEASKIFFINNNKSAIDVLICHLHSGMSSNSSKDMINFLNVPILSPLHIYMQDTLDNYINNSAGISAGLNGNELTTWTVTPELIGGIEPILIGGSVSIGIDPLTGADLKVFTPYNPGIIQLAQRAIAWSNLRNKPNKDKKISLVYFDNTHDEGMPTGGRLNIESSISNILKNLYNEGYDLGFKNDSYFNSQYILSLILDHGSNSKNYTDNDLKSLILKGAPTMRVSDYIALYNKLPLSLKKQVEDVWGPAPGNLMVTNNVIVFPGMVLGNIFLGPQPIWKWDGNLSNLNNNTLPPTHQYIAFYLWLNYVFNANAVVHIGEHGTLELLPGHTAGMTENDWSNTLIGKMPNIYLYSGSNDDAKRRSYSVLISHLTPPVIKSTLYGNLQEMHDLLSSFDEAYNLNNSQRMSILKKEILNKLSSENSLKERLNITDKTPFGTVLNRMHDYLHQLENSLTSYGLHTFGKLPEKEILDKFVESIINYDYENRKNLTNKIYDLLNLSVHNEINSLINALNGEFIEPGASGDLVRDLSVLPTGRNIYSFNPKKVPDSAAMIIGTAAEKIIEEYLKNNNGKYPETIGTYINGRAIVLDKGSAIASIFYYLGVKPIVINGIVMGTEVIPLNELNGRPRMDVYVGTSVSLINLCYNAIELIDNAILQVILLNESSEKNFVLKHYNSLLPQIKSELLEKGLSESDAQVNAERLARSRIFGLPEGADPHAMGTARLLRSTESWTDDDLLEAYLNYETFIYGANFNGVSGRMVAEKLIKTVDITSTIRNTLTENAGRLGGIVRIEFVVEKLTNKDIEGYVVNTGNIQIKNGEVTGISVKTVSEALFDDITMTLFNPAWRNGMLKEGSAGERSIALKNSIFIYI